MTAKAAMELLGVHDNRAVRLPLVEADDALVDLVRSALSEAGLLP
jgi:4-hydroxy-tetrahydrodipicolinate synthase